MRNSEPHPSRALLTYIDDWDCMPDQKCHDWPKLGASVTSLNHPKFSIRSLATENVVAFAKQRRRRQHFGPFSCGGMQHASPSLVMQRPHSNANSPCSAVHFLRLPNDRDRTGLLLVDVISSARAFVRGHYYSRIASQDLPGIERDKKHLDIMCGTKKGIFSTGGLFLERT